MAESVQFIVQSPYVNLKLVTIWMAAVEAHSPALLDFLEKEYPLFTPET